MMLVWFLLLGMINKHPCCLFCPITSLLGMICIHEKSNLVFSFLEKHDYVNYGSIVI